MAIPAWHDGCVASEGRWSAHRAAAAAEVRDGETVLWIVPALSNYDPDDFYGPSELMVVFVAMQRWLSKRSARAAAKESLFPLAPRMVLALTDQRLLVWSARRRFRLGEFIGFVSLDRIVHAEVVTVGAGWRTARVDLANEPPVLFKLPGQLAEEFASELSGQRMDS
jgi:hypothetical protein